MAASVIPFCSKLPEVSSSAICRYPASDRARQIDRGHRKKSLDEEKKDPGESPLGGSTPDQTEGPGQVRQCARSTLKITGHGMRHCEKNRDRKDRFGLGRLAGDLKGR